MDNYQRSHAIDILKGIAMCFVIWGHTLQYATCGHLVFYELPVFRFIYSFHMPLFSVLSGYLLGLSLHERTFSENINHKIATIFWPIITANILKIPLVNFPRYIIGILTGNTPLSAFQTILNVRLMSGFWFLWVVLSCSIAAFVIFQGMKRPFTKLIASVLCFVLTLEFPCGTLVFNMFPFFIVGTSLGERKPLRSILAKHSACIEVVIVLGFIMFLPFFKDKTYIYGPIYFNDISFVYNVCIYVIRLGCGFFGSLSIAILLKWASRLLTRIEFNSLSFPLQLIKECIAFIGANSLKFYILQSFIFDGGLLGIVFRRIPSIMPFFLTIYQKTIYQFLFTPLIALLIIACLYAIIFQMDTRKIAQWVWKP